MKTRFAVLALAVLAECTRADFWKCDLQLSTDGGLTWGDNAVVPAAGGTVQSRWAISAERSEGLVSIAGFRLSQVDLSGSLMSDTIGNVQRQSTATLASSIEISVQGNRIDRTTDPDVLYIAVANNAVRFGGVADNPWVCLTYDFNVGPSSFRQIVFSAQPSHFQFPAVFTNNFPTFFFPISQTSFDGATITVLPTPASAMILGLAGLGASRRRR